MSVITDIWRQLVRRRLLPVALLLVAALVAVPVVLAKQPEPAPPAPSPSSGASDAKAVLTTEPIVAFGEPVAAAHARVPLGNKHDIFKPTKKAPKVEKAASEESSGDVQKTTPPATSGGSGSEPPAAPDTSPTPPATEPEEPKTYPMYSLRVRFNGEKKTLPRRSALPSADAPLIIYLGLADRNKTAVFMLDATLTAQGDGECHPTPQNCETVHLQEGDTEFLDIADANGESTGTGFQLDLVEINKGKTTNADRAARSSKLAKVSRAATFGRTLAAGFGSTR